MEGFKFLLKRGNKSKLSEALTSSLDGEPIICLDTGEFFIKNNGVGRKIGDIETLVSNKGELPSVGVEGKFYVVQKDINTPPEVFMYTPNGYQKVNDALQVTKTITNASTTAPVLVTIPYETTDFRTKRLNVLKHIPDETNVVKTISDFSASTSSELNTTDYIEFVDGVMRLKTSFIGVPTKGAIDSGYLYTSLVDLPNLNKIASVSMTFDKSVSLTRTYYYKYLVKDGAMYKKWTSNGWQDVSTNPTYTTFQNQGHNDLTWLTDDKLRLLTNQTDVQVALWSDDNITNVRLNTKGTPKPQIAKMSGNIDVTWVKTVDFFNVLGSAGTTGDIRVVVSRDKGLTWESYYQGAWSILNLNTSEFKQKGMSADLFNSIATSTWDAYILNYTNLKFAFYLENDGNFDNFKWQYDLQGKWRVVKESAYDIDIINTTTGINFYENGTYKINI